MKILLCCLLILSSCRANAQYKPVAASDSSEADTFTYVEQMPEFRGDVHQYIASHQQYIVDENSKKITGTVVISFTVHADGQVRKPVVAKTTDVRLNDDAVRLISNMPKWLPGRQNGIPVTVKYILRIAYK